MLGLYNPKKAEQTADEQYQSDEGEPDEGDPELKAGKPTWMKPLILSAIEPHIASSPLLPVSPRVRAESGESEEPHVDAAGLFSVDRLTFCSEHAHADVPAWIEMMNRTDRVRQLAYVVRVTNRVKEEQKSDDGTDYLGPTEKDSETFLRFRTGRELAQIMRVGQSVRHYVLPEDISSSKSRKQERRLTGNNRESSFAARGVVTRQSYSESAPGTATPQVLSWRRESPVLSLSPRQENPDMVELPPEFSFESLPIRDDESDDESIESVIELENLDSDDPILQAVLDAEDEAEEIVIECEMETEGSDDEADLEASEGERKKKKGMVGKSKALLGKSVKATAGGVVKTAKLGVKTTKLTGKVSKGQETVLL